MKTKITITITKDDLKAALKSETDSSSRRTMNCVVGQAIQRTLGTRDIEVRKDGVLIGDDCFVPDDDAISVIQTYDNSIFWSRHTPFIQLEAALNLPKTIVLTPI